MQQKINLYRVTYCEFRTRKCRYFTELSLVYGVTGKHIPPRDIIPMGIDSL